MPRNAPERALRPARPSTHRRRRRAAAGIASSRLDRPPCIIAAALCGAFRQNPAAPISRPHASQAASCSIAVSCCVFRPASFTGEDVLELSSAWRSRVISASAALARSRAAVRPSPRIHAPRFRSRQARSDGVEGLAELFAAEPADTMPPSRAALRHAFRAHRGWRVAAAARPGDLEAVNDFTDRSLAGLSSKLGGAAELADLARRCARSSADAAGEIGLRAASISRSRCAQCRHVMRCSIALAGAATAAIVSSRRRHDARRARSISISSAIR